MKIGRNDPCHCGSEKKFKDCHGALDKDKQWKKMAIYGSIAIVVIWFILNIINADKAPEGKIWSTEHGHWHDITPTSNPLSESTSTNIPQPKGSVPEGKEWSFEHGHWHDINSLNNK